MTATFTRCDVCNTPALARAEPWRCPQCRTLHVPGWDDSHALPQDPDDGREVWRGILIGAALVAVAWAAVVGIYLVCRGGVS